MLAAAFMTFVCQVLVQSLLVKRVPVTITAVELRCMNGRLQVLTKCFRIDKRPIAFMAV